MPEVLQHPDEGVHRVLRGRGLGPLRGATGVEPLLLQGAGEFRGGHGGLVPPAVSRYDRLTPYKGLKTPLTLCEGFKTPLTL